ncbi:3-dehydroquinate synthase [Methanobrevibacter sp.]|uniref:3-dehydroquinate synthase n=1 Tax=Methanobrevibacter sp. TaxID=66852 RepID=UPI00389029FF
MNIFFGEDASAQLLMLTNNYDKFFVLTDENIYKLYSSLIASLVPEKEVVKIVIPAGEDSKNIENVMLIWTKLLESKAGRDSLLINLGGGTISDIGGFAASTYKRGIDFINVPTTLLAMIDAAIGGKNGINFNNYKNQIGLFSEPKCVIINKHFLKTLNERDVKSGLAEMMKYAFIADASFLDLDSDNYLDFIEKAATIKEDVVSLDMNESGLRKMLNFGHTVGHALESYYLDKENYLTHGEAVALGIYSALYLSVKYCGLDEKWLFFYEMWFKGNLNVLNLNDFDVDSIYEYISHDKKNKGGKPQFVLISAPEKPQIDIEVCIEDIKESISILLNKFSE